jgi:hypothetical protein
MPFCSWSNRRSAIYEFFEYEYRFTEYEYEFEFEYEYEYEYEYRFTEYEYEQLDELLTSARLAPTAHALWNPNSTPPPILDS